MVNKVEVIKEFPGYEIGDVLELAPWGLFEPNYSDPLGAIESALVESKPGLSKRYVLQYLGTYFKDVSTYAVKSEKAISKRIGDLKHWLKADDKELDPIAKTVWQNLVWELEWVLGKRELGETL